MKSFSRFFLGLGSLVFLASCSSYQTKPAYVAGTEPDSEYGRLPTSQCDSSKYKDCKEARRNDVAQQYMLGHDGTLYRKINSAVCSVTTGVDSIKISQHPRDVAVLYFKKNNDLYLLNHDREVRRRGECPSSKNNIKLLMEDVEKYTVTSNTSTNIVNAALSAYGDFRAWDNVNVVYSDSNVEEFQMNSCFGSAGKSFSSYVLFTRDRSDKITKVKVTGNVLKKDASKTTDQSYRNIGQFTSSSRVCQ